MNLETMDALSRSFALALFAAYPEWERFASNDRDEGDAADYLVVQVPALDAADALPMIIVTENGELTIGFDHYHAHFDWPNDGGEGPAWCDPFRLIAAIVGEDLAFASAWNGDEWRGSWIVEDEDDISTNHPTGARIRVRSWKGTLNAD